MKSINIVVALSIFLILARSILFAQTQTQPEHHHHMEQQQQQMEEHMQHEMPSEETVEKTQTGISLEQLEEIALQQNPTIRQAEATVKAAEGRLKQAGLYPNPTVGYMGEELSWKESAETSEHFFFAEQNILLGGKRGKAKDVFEKELLQAKTVLEIQNLRVRSGVRINYYRTLAAQIRLDVHKKLEALSQEVLQTSNELFNVGAADEPDVLEAKVEAGAFQIAAEAAEIERENAWRLLAASVGNPEMEVQNVGGSLVQPLPELNRETLLADLLEKSPQVKVAELQLQRAEAAIYFAKSQRVPDLRLRAGVGYNNEEFVNTKGPVGWESFVEVGIPLPLFNRNQGNIAISGAEKLSAEQEVRRVKATLAAQFSELFGDYLKSKTAAQRFAVDLLPQSRRGYQLYREKFESMAAAYPQVLIAQRNMYQLEVQYVSLLAAAWSSTARLENFLVSGGAFDRPPLSLSPDETVTIGSDSRIKPLPEFMDLPQTNGEE